MFNRFRKLTALLVTAVMLMTMLPLNALAAVIAVDNSAPFSPQQMAMMITPGDGVYVTYEFYNGATQVDRRIVKAIEGSVTAPRPATPTDPSDESNKFVGWFIGSESGEAYTPGPTAAPEASATVRVYAKFSKVFHVYFLDVDGANVIATREAKAPDYRVTLPLETDYQPTGMLVTGWKIKGTDTAFTADTVVTEDTYVSPETTPIWWVTFDTQGGTALASKHVQNGQPLSLDEATIGITTKVGYAFGGWYEDAEYTGPTGASITPTKDTTIFAKWNPASVKYTVVYWGENADDAGYSVLATDVTKTADTGTALTLNATTGALPNSVTDRAHFMFNNSDTVTLAADGSSVLNVYFARKSYTLTFRDWEDGHREGWHWVKGKWVPVHTINAKYNAKISDKFPVPGYVGRAWKAESESDYYYALQTLDRMPGKNVTFDLYDKSSQTEKTIHYYVRNVDDTAWTLLKDVKTYFNFITYDEEYHPIDGFTRQSKQEAGFSGDIKDFHNKEVSLYYLRNKYALTFNNYGSQTSEQVAYEASLSGRNWTPSRPSSFSANAVFKGWYPVAPANITSPDGQKFNFASEKMPASNLVLYAYWQEPTIKITVDIGEGEGNPFSSNEGKGTSVEASDAYGDAKAAIDDAGKTVSKWVVGGSSNPIDIKQPRDTDTKVYAVFAGNAAYRVIYGLGSVTGDAPVDNNTYETGTGAKAKPFPTGITVPNGEQFAYWTDATVPDSKYYPGDSVPIYNSNVTLTAIYVPQGATVSVTYHSNFGTDTTVTVDAGINNSEITVLGYDAVVGLPQRDGYDFIGWNTQADGKGTSFAAGSSARVDNTDSNDLFAKWKLKKYTITTSIDNGGTITATGSVE
ncbi:InlB B-repeat-containing protein, partial [Bacillota bacterium Meth-B3]